MTTSEDLCINIKADDESYFYQGYPRGNLIKLFCVVLVLWNQNFSFPIRFKTTPGLDLDETQSEIEALSKLTPALDAIFEALEQNEGQKLFDEVKDFLIALTPRGVLT